MHTLSYTISPGLQAVFKKIEILRGEILLHPLSGSSEIKLRFNANIERIYYSLHLSGNMLTQKEIIQILMTPGKKLFEQKEREVINYKKGLDFITSVWLVNEKPIMPTDIIKLYKYVADSRPPVSENQIMEILVFLQTSREHSLIQAFISYIQFMLLFAEKESESGRVIRLLPYIFLYKPGLDFRGFLVIEAYFYKNEKLIRELKEAAMRNESVTVWIEHFVSYIANQLEEISGRIVQVDKTEINSKTWNLSERQKEILTNFDQPGMRITNKKVQAVFRVSQITASRDLARLAALGLLFSYGKGRSVYYMRA